MTDLRAAFDIRTGALTTDERLRSVWGLRDVSYWVPPELEALTRERHRGAVNAPVGSGGGPVLLLNGRWARCLNRVALEAGQALVEAGSGDLLAALLEPEQAERLRPTLGTGIVGLPGRPLAGRQLLSRPWHVRSDRDACLRLDLHRLIAERTGIDAGDLSEQGRLCVHASATVHPSVIFDPEQGDILIDERAVIRPGAIIIGPAFIGAHTHVLERTLIKANTAIGPWCKVAGEIGGTIMQGYSNKAHDGHIGDSWIGEWVNLGAGTTNSNLLNTYGEVVCRATPEGPNERTGETFLGCILGDHVKVAICTRIMTGAIVQTGTMYAAGVPISGAIRRFRWCTDAGVNPYRFDKFMEVATAAMARRKLVPTPALEARLASLANSSQEARP